LGSIPPPQNIRKNRFPGIFPGIFPKFPETFHPFATLIIYDFKINFEISFSSAKINFNLSVKKSINFKN
jgi:hypothetical protein